MRKLQTKYSYEIEHLLDMHLELNILENVQILLLMSNSVAFKQILESSESVSSLMLPLQQDALLFCIKHQGYENMIYCTLQFTK